MRVVSLAINLPGPMAVSRLIELGAQALKVEPPTGDPLRKIVPVWYATLHEGVEVVTWNLKQSDRMARLLSVLAQTDVLITAQRPAALARLGLAGLESRFPQLVHVEIVGHNGERADVPGHDLTYQATHGTLSPPQMPLVPIADLLGSERAVSSALAGVLERSRTGRGGRHRVVLEDAARLAGDAVRHGLMGPDTPLGGALPTYAIYPTADGFVALGAVEPHFAARVHDLIGVTHQELKNAFITRTSAHWEDLGARADIPLISVRSPTSRRPRQTSPEKDIQP